MPPQFVNAPSPPYSTVSINVVDEFGAKGDNITDNSPMIEAALTELKRRLDSQPTKLVRGHIYFPHSLLPYRISRPIILDRERLGIVGENFSTTIDHTITFAGPVVVMGIRSKELNSQGATLLASSYYRPDLYGDLDNSVISGPKQRWGFRTNNNASLVFEGTPADLGPVLDPSISTVTRGYKAVNSGFTLELAIKNSGGIPFYAGTTAGIINVGTNNNTVFSLARGGVTNQFDLNMNMADGSVLQSNMAVGQTQSGIMKIAFQVDLINRRIQGYFNGNQVAISSGGTFFTNSGQTSLIDNKYFSCLMGINNLYADNFRTLTQSYGQVGMDITFAGVSLSNALLYKNNGIGTPQARLDNGTLNDNYRFFGGDNTNRNKYFYLDMSDDPDSDYTKRFMTSSAFGVAGKGKGFLMEVSMYTLLGGILHNYISDITLNGTPQNPTVVVGGVLDPTFERVKFSAGNVCVNCLNLIANYTLTFKDCYFSAYNHCIKGSQSLMEFEGCHVHNMPRVAFKMVASNINLNKSLVAFGSHFTDNFYQGYGQNYGGLNIIRDIIIDFEGTVYKEGVFYLEQNPNGVAPASYYEIQNIYSGTVGSGYVVKAVQKENYDGANYMVLNINNLETNDVNYSCYLNINGNSILGNVVNPAPDVGCPMIHTGEFTTDCNVQIEHRSYKALPRNYNWVANGHRILMQSPKEGQFQEFRCIQTGRIGTSGAPRFAGINPLNSRSYNIAMYGYTHACSAVSVSRSGASLDSPIYQ